MKKYKFWTYLRKVEDYIHTATDVFETVVEWPKKPTARDYIYTGSKLFSSLLHSDFTSINWGEWKRATRFPDSLFDYLHENMKTRYKYSSLKTIEDFTVNYFEVDGFHFLLHTNDKSLLIPKHSDEEKYNNKIGKFLWEFARSTSITFVDETLSYRGPKQNNQLGVRLMPMDRGSVYHSDKAKSIKKEICSYLDKGHNRSVILQGRPGTGKSCILKCIDYSLEGLSLFVPGSSFSSKGIYLLLNLIHTLRPDFVFVDDIDRFIDNDSFLEHLESINKKVKLFMTTVNHLEKLAPAVIRPGRFDQIIEVNDLGNDVLEKLVGDFPDHIKTKVRNWPTAYLAELRKRASVYGKEDIEEHFHDLEYRVNYAEWYNNN